VTFVRDIRYALRQLRAAPTFTAVAVLSLALGIGANTAIFSLVDAVLLRFLPVERPEELVRIAHKDNPDNDSFTNPIWEALRDRQRIFAGVLAFGGTRFNLAQAGEAQRIRGHFVSGSYFRALGVGAAAGRLPGVENDRRGCAPTVVLGHAFWRKHYGGDPGAIGGRLMLDGKPFEVVGVAQRGFTGIQVGEEAEVFVPLCAEKIVRGENSSLDQRSYWWLTFVGRKKPDMPLAQLNAGLEVLSQAVFEATLPENQRDGGRQYLSRRLAATPEDRAATWLKSQLAQPLYILMGLTGIVLMIACANVANLMVARATARRRELAIRLALGGSRRRLIGQLLVEALVIAGAGALLGLLFAQWASRLLVRFMSTQRQPLFLDLAPDLRVLGFTAAVAVATALLFGLAPAFRATAVAPIETLKEQGRAISPGRPGRILIAAQIALSLLLVAGGGLLLRTFRNLVHQETGFDRTNVMLLSLDIRNSEIAPEQREQFYARLLERLRGLPGVRSASRSEVTPISGSTWQFPIEVDGYEPTGPRDASVHANPISSGYFATLGTPLVAGRDFNDADRPGSPRVCVINETLARKFFAGRNPIGREIRSGFPKLDKVSEVVGVVKDTKYRNLRDPVPPTFYMNIVQEDRKALNANFQLRIAVPLAAATAACREAIAALSKDAVIEFRIFESQVNESLQRERMLALLSGFFGALALLLAGVGIYGVMAYRVSQRRHEIGIRMALGADPARVLAAVLGEAGLLVAAGLAAGGAGVLCLTRFLEKLLFGVKPNDPATLLGAAAVLCAAALAAAYLPARRAAAIDPMKVLREE
jgi:putative ABC transport system permease protein